MARSSVPPPSTPRYKTKFIQMRQDYGLGLGRWRDGSAGELLALPA